MLRRSVLLLALIPLALPACARAQAFRADSAYGSHAMLYSNMPMGVKEQLFLQAARGGKSMIRVDVQLQALFPTQIDEPKWEPLDEILLLSRRYGIRILGVLNGQPLWNARCPVGQTLDQSVFCPPLSLPAWQNMVRQVVRHSAGGIMHWEVLNEPDGKYYHGTAADYAAQLEATYRAIKQADPGGKVVLGGVTNDALAGWIGEVMGHNTSRSFDIAAIHLAGSLHGVTRSARRWRSWFRAQGFRREIWVTEAGYPSDRRWQPDPRYRYGERAQADFLPRLMDELVKAGMSKIFITGRDNLRGLWASYGIYSGISDPEWKTHTLRRKPAFYAVARKARSGRTGWTRISVAASERRGQIAGDPGCVGYRQVVIQTMRPGGKSVQRVRSGPDGTFSWSETGPGMKHIVLRSDGVCRAAHTGLDEARRSAQ